MYYVSHFAANALWGKEMPKDYLLFVLQLKNVLERTLRAY